MEQQLEAIKKEMEILNKQFALSQREDGDAALVKEIGVAQRDAIKSGLGNELGAMLSEIRKMAEQ